MVFEYPINMALRGFIGFLLFLAIGLTFSSYIFFNLTDHAMGQQFFSKSISDRISEQATPDDFLAAEKDVNFSCKEKGYAYLNITDAQLKLNCPDIGRLPFKEIVSNAIYDNIYYKKYDCSFFDCFNTKDISSLISQQVHSKYRIYYLYLMAIDVILAILLFFVSSSWYKRANAFGYILLISGVLAPLLFITETIFQANMDFMKNVLYVQLGMFAVGVILLVLAMIFKPKEESIYNG